MKFLNLDIDVQVKPELDKSFIPMVKFNRAFLKGATKEIGVAIERADGLMASVKTKIHGTEEMRAADCFYVNKLVKTLLWMKGGFRIYISGDEDIYSYIRSAYSDCGQHNFDYHYFENIYENGFEVVYIDKLPEAKDCPQKIGGHLKGCRIGFDAGGSDRKVSAVIDGETVYSEEVVWFPKITADPDYHYNEICAAFKSAAGHMPRVDGVGISSAGIYINNRAMNASLFLKVPKDLYNQKVKDIYIRAVKDTFGEIPYSVVNDGDVTALAGAMSIGKNNVLGIAMGTSEAVGYVDPQGCITGWLNELAFVPVDANPDALIDEWSLDIGCGCKYFSQDAVNKLAAAAGIPVDASLSPAEKLKVVQSYMEKDDERAAKIYRTIGVYLSHTLAYYYDLYGFENILLLGRVMSGKGGDILLDTCKTAMAVEYPEVYSKISFNLPNEYFRRVGQSSVAASLPDTAD